MKWWYGISLCLSVFLLWPDWCRAVTDSREFEAETEDFSPDYGEIDEALKKMLPEHSDISFSSVVKEFMSGNLKNTFRDIFFMIMDKFLSEIRLNWTSLFQMTGIVVIGAVFANLSGAFAGKYAAETGFYVTYIVLFSLLTVSFSSIVIIAENVVNHLIELMRSIIPVYGTVITYSVGISTGNAWYQLLMIMMTAVDWLLSKIIMNLIKIYVIVFIVNQISGEDYFSKMCEFMHSVIDWSLKSLLGTMLGLNMIQSMVLPAFDQVKNGWFMKLVTAIPGVGNAFGSAAKAVVASGVLLKNAVGAAAVAVLCILCAWPLVQLLVITLMYKLLEAMIQPVTDPRLLDCIHAVGDGALMLFKACGTILLLFMISLAMMTYGTQSVV